MVLLAFPDRPQEGFFYERRMCILRSSFFYYTVFRGVGYLDGSPDPDRHLRRLLIDGTRPCPGDKEQGNGQVEANPDRKEERIDLLDGGPEVGEVIAIDLQEPEGLVLSDVVAEPVVGREHRQQVIEHSPPEHHAH